MGTSNQRKYKIGFIVSILEKAWSEGKNIDEKKFLAMICLKFGSAERYIKEILKQLETLLIIHIEKGVILKGKETIQSNLL